MRRDRTFHKHGSRAVQELREQQRAALMSDAWREYNAAVGTEREGKAKSDLLEVQELLR